MAKPVIQGNQIVFAMVEQTGTTTGVPANPEFHVLPRVDGDITDNPSYTKSARVDTTRQGSESILTSLPIDGSFNDELAVADPTLHMILEGTLQGRFSTEIDYTAATLAFSDTGTIIDSAALAFADAEEGQFIGVTGATDETLNRSYRIITKTDDGTVTVAPAPAVTEAEGATVNISGKMLRSGKEEIGYTFQKRIPTDTGYLYETYQDCQFTSFSTSQTTESLFTTSYAAMGLSKVDSTAEISGQTDAVVDNERILGAVNGIPYVWIDNVPTETADLMATDISVDIDNGSTGLSILNNLGYGAIQHDLIAVTGNLNTYVDKTNPLVEKLKSSNSVLFGLTIELTDVNGNKLIITRDSTIYTSLTQTETSNGTTYMNTGATDADGKNNDYLTTVQIDYIAAP